VRFAYLLQWLSALSMVPILVIAAKRWRALEPGAQWIARGFMVYLAFSAVMFVMSMKRIPNRIVAEAVLLLATPFLLLGFSKWQRGQLAAALVRATIPLFLGIWVLVLLLAERSNPFGSVEFPVQSIFLVAVAGYTLVANGITAVGNPASEGWFWISAGILLSSGVQATLHPVSNVLFPNRPDLVILAFNVNAAIDVVANLLVARGMWCKGTLLASGGSSSSLVSLRSY